LQRHRRRPADFTRKRQLPFPVVCTFLLNLIRASIQAELDTFFRLIRGRDVAVAEVTASAFCQARQKLRHTAFIELSHAAVDAFYDNMPVKTWWHWGRSQGNILCAKCIAAILVINNGISGKAGLLSGSL